MATTLLRGSRIIDLRNAMTTLAQRRLAPISDTRVSLHLVLLRDPATAYLDAVKKLQRRQVEAQAMEEGSEERRQEELSIARDLAALEDQTFEVELPKRRLTAEDLPTTYKTKDGAGEANSEGRAWIAGTLAPEFFELVDPDEEQDEAGAAP